MAFVMYFVTCA